MAANPGIAKEFAGIAAELEALASRPGMVPYVKRAAQRVIDRLRGWDVLSTAIWDPDSSSVPAREALRNLSSDESSLSVAFCMRSSHIPICPQL